MNSSEINILQNNIPFHYHYAEIQYTIHALGIHKLQVQLGSKWREDFSYLLFYTSYGSGNIFKNLLVTNGIVYTCCKSLLVYIKGYGICCFNCAKMVFLQFCKKECKKFCSIALSPF